MTASPAAIAAGQWAGPEALVRRVGAARTLSSAGAPVRPVPDLLRR